MCEIFEICGECDCLCNNSCDMNCCDNSSCSNGDSCCDSFCLNINTCDNCQNGDCCTCDNNTQCRKPTARECLGLTVIMAGAVGSSLLIKAGALKIIALHKMGYGTCATPVQIKMAEYYLGGAATCIGSSLFGCRIMCCKEDGAEANTNRRTRTSGEEDQGAPLNSHANERTHLSAASTTIRTAASINPHGENEFNTANSFSSFIKEEEVRTIISAAPTQHVMF